MAEYVDTNTAGGRDDGDKPESSFRQMTMEQLRRGTMFTADIEQDFELDDIYESDDDSEEDEFWRLGERGPAKAINLYTVPMIDGEWMENAKDISFDGGVKKLVLQKGTGVRPPTGSKLFFQYVGFIAGDPEPFDSCTGRGNSLILDGRCSLIRGVFLGLATMELNEVAQLLLTPDYAYGKMGCPPRIPADANVIFNVRAGKFLSANELENPVFMSREERSKLDFAGILEATKRVRAEANAQFIRKNYSKAVRSYRKGIDMLEDYWKVDDKQVLERETLLACLFCNLAQSYLEMKKGPQACNACKNGLKQQGGTVYADKLLFRFAKAKHMLGSHEDALQLLKKARQAGAEKPPCDRLEEEINAVQAHCKEVEKEMCKLMLKQK